MFKPFNDIFQVDFEVLWEYILDNLANRFIQTFTSSDGKSIFFMKKPDNSLQFCGYYQRPNLIIQKITILQFLFMKLLIRLLVQRYK